MPNPKSFFRVFTESGPLIALAVAVALLVGIAGPASAQFFNFPSFGGPPRPPQGLPQRGGGFGWPGGDLFAPFRQPAPRRERVIREDYSHAPAPEKRETVPERTVLVLGDAMADWLAYGLEDTYADQPDMGVIRKPKTYSGLIRYQPRGDPADWAAAAKGILATEKPEAIVVMLGLNDRISIREPAAEKSDAKPAEKKDARAKSEAKSADAKSAAKPEDATGKASEKAVDTELSPDDAADNSDAPPAIAPEKSARSPNGIDEFRDERWIELYNRKIQELITVLKSKGVPVLWVGLPAVRGTNATSDMLFLDSLYREAAAKAGITYVDVWDGFVDEAGRYLQQGPDFEGQIAGCAPMTACTSPRPAPASLRIMSSGKSRGCWPRVPRRSRCRPNRLPPTPMPSPASRRRVRWRDRSCRWWNPPSVPINCSAARGRGRPR